MSETKFKKTPIGEIPEDWEVVKLGKIIGYIKGKKPKIVAKEPKDGWLPYLSTEYLRNNNPTQFVKITGNEIIVEDGNILLLWDGSNAGEFFLAKKGVLSSTMVKIFLKKDVYDSLFLFYLLKHREPFLKGQTKGTGIPHVDKNVLNALLLPLPPLPEQKKIVEILRTVDEAIEKTDLAIEKTERLKKGLMQRLLTKGIKHERFKKTELGEIPEEWKVVRVREVLELLTDYEANGSFSKLKENVRVYDTPNYAWYVRATDLEHKQYPPDGDVRYVDKESYEFLRKTKLFGRELLMVKRGEVGKVYIMPHVKMPATLGPNLYLLKLKNELVDNVFLYYYFTSPFGKRELKRRNAPTTLGALYKEDVKNFRIPLPPLEEQKKIAEILMTVDKKLELLRKRKEKLERIKKGFMKDLLTGRRVSVTTEKHK